jgi:hypothetical protein
MITLSALTIGLAGCSGAASGPSATSASGGNGSSSSSAAGSSTIASTGAGTTASDWQLVPAHGAANIQAAGLTVLSEEGSAEHYHAHLDVIADGKAITVPAYIGFSFGSDGQPNGISALHTHDDSGIVHIEAPTTGLTYTLGQALREWGVLDGTNSTPGSAHSSITDWTAYVNGSKQSGNPKDVVLHAHDEVALVHGTPPATVPSTYSFPSGY